MRQAETLGKINITCTGSGVKPIDQLRDFQGSLKTLKPEQLGKLKRSILKYGFTFPVFTWQDKILDGHQRLFATKELVKEGYEIDDIPVVEIEAENKKEAGEKLLALNSQYAKITEDGLSEYINETGVDISELAGDLDLPEFDLAGFLDGINNEQGGLTGDDEVPEVPEEAVTKFGDLWICEGHRILCADATDVEQVEVLMNGVMADMIFTDPPYGVDYSGGLQFGKNGDVKKNNREKLIHDDSDLIYEKVVPILADFCNGAIYTWYADTKPIALYNAVNKVGDIHALLIWVKNGGYGALNANYKQKHEPCLYWKAKGKKLNFIGSTTETTVWNIDKDGRNEFHPTQKPVALAEKAILNHDAIKILDLFLGSGSTLIAAEKTGRKLFGCELEPAYVDICLERWQNYTGLEATLEKTGQTFSEIKHGRT